jgi:hypothetical protein
VGRGRLALDRVTVRLRRRRGRERIAAPPRALAAASARVSTALLVARLRAYEADLRQAALGTYNFSGDLGKIAGSVVAGAAAALAGGGWPGPPQAPCLLAAVLVFAALARLGAGAPDDGASRKQNGGLGSGRPGFGALAAIGMIDNTRTAFSPSCPSLIAKGVTVAGWGALALVFAGGAAGKFVCGLAAERLGVIRTVVLTEAATSAGILAVLLAPLSLALGILLPLGIALNGTSSVLYGTVADLVLPARRSRAYGLYTLSVGALAGAVAVRGRATPPACRHARIVGAVVLTVPLCLALRPAVTAPPR